MAERPVFVSTEKSPFFKTILVSFDWNGGFAKVQKQKNINALHNEFLRKYPELKVLEISSKSMQEKGVDLSAFNLKKYVPGLDQSVPVECIYQSSKVFEFGGPYEDLLTATSRQSKKDERLKNSGRMIGFQFQGVNYPLKPSNIFYDYIYMTALLENPELAEEVLKYDGFTDIEFNPNKGINCQARAAAIFKGMVMAGKKESIADFDLLFTSLSSMVPTVEVRKEPHREKEISEKNQTEATSTMENTFLSIKKETKKETESIKICAGMIVRHKKFGDGTVQEVDDCSLKVNFEKFGEKKLQIDWCLKNCEIVDG